MLRGTVAESLLIGDYEVVDGIPLLAGPLDDSGQSRQAAYFDAVDDDEFEIERPHGSPPLIGWLLAEKFRRSVAALPCDLGAHRADRLQRLRYGCRVARACGGAT